MKKENEEPKITFSDLSMDLKILVALCWVMIALNALAFVVGFIGEILGVI